ncbi:MAG: PPOX class F420-dependent oxidoreductase [Rubrobacteraceae bacterium]|nr:PPOX class F420-dependent oxidoreductase [Rubrobacteraceae bacterium]
MNQSTQILEPLVKQWAVLLTTYRRDGTPVGTAVNIVVEGDLAYFRTWATAWKLRRIRNNPEVEFAPSTALGRPTAKAIQARARVLEGEDSARAGRLLARKYPAMHGLLVPLVHRLRGNRTMHVELTPVGPRRGEQARCGAAKTGAAAGHEERAFYFPGWG